MFDGTAMLGLASIIDGSLADGAFNKTTNREKEIKTRINVGTKMIIHPNKQQNR